MDGAQQGGGDSIRDSDRELAAAFLERWLAGEDADPDPSREPQAALLERRHRASRGEAEFLDVWGDAVDACELVVATLAGLHELELEQMRERERSDQEQIAWMLAYTYADGCLRIADDILHLVRRSSFGIASAALRTQLEMGAKARLLCRDHSLASPFVTYAARNRWQNSATTHFALRGVDSSMGKIGGEARQRAEAMTAEHRMLPGDEGWAHDYLVEHDSAYRRLASQGKRKGGPTLRDIEKAAEVEPLFRAIRTQTNPEVHGNRVTVGPSDQDPDDDLGVLLLTTLAASQRLSLVVFESFSVFGEDHAAVADGIAALGRPAYDAIITATDLAQRMEDG